MARPIRVEPIGSFDAYIAEGVKGASLAELADAYRRIHVAMIERFDAKIRTDGKDVRIWTEDDV